METRLVPMRQIKILPERGRKGFKRLPELAESIKANGFIHPVLVTQGDKEGEYHLVAGERRYRAAALAGLAEIPVTFRENLTPVEQKILELEENVAREDLTWPEQCELHRQIHEFKTEHTEGAWDQKKTAELVNLTPSAVSKQIKLATELKANPELMEKVKHLDFNSAIKVVAQQKEIARVQRLQDSGRLIVTHDLQHGDCRDLIKLLPDASVDCLITDPPYGLEKLDALMKPDGSVKMTGHKLMNPHHNLDLAGILDILRTLAPELHRVLKPGAHFYMFCAFQYVGEFIKALDPLEFQPPLLIWDRQKGTTPGYGYNYLNTTEPIIYGHNPPRGRRLLENKYNILQYKEVPRHMRVYPTEKPQDLLGALIKQSTNAGETVLDLFAGSASTLKAARTLGRRGIGFEKDKDAYLRAQGQLQGDSDASPNTPQG